MDLTGKTRAEVTQLLANAERMLANPKLAARHKQATELAEAARGQLATMPAVGSRRPPAGPGDSPADQAPGQLRQAAVRLAAAFDLSPPANTRQPHALTGKDGSAKVGGRQRNREAKRDLYISFKSGERVVALGFLLTHADDAVTGGGWYVVDRTGTAEAPTEPEFGTDFAAALEAFEAKLAELAPRRS